MNASDINLYSYDFGAAVWRYSKSSSSTGFDQINDLLETYYGTKSSQLFKAAYFLTLSKYAIQLIPDDKHGDLYECGLWQTSGADAVEAIRKDFGFSKIVGADCANISVKQFADKLRGVESAIKVKLSNRSAALN